MTLIVHPLSLLLATCSAHLCLLSHMLLATYNVCHITLFPDSVCTLSIPEGDSYHDSLHLSLGCDQFLKLGVDDDDDDGVT